MTGAFQIWDLGYFEKIDQADSKIHMDQLDQAQGLRSPTLIHPSQDAASQADVNSDSALEKAEKESPPNVDFEESLLKESQETIETPTPRDKTSDIIDPLSTVSLARQFSFVDLIDGTKHDSHDTLNVEEAKKNDSDHPDLIRVFKDELKSLFVLGDDPLSDDESNDEEPDSDEESNDEESDEDSDGEDDGFVFQGSDLEMKMKEGGSRVDR
jgi:hypothetical protein